MGDELRVRERVDMVQRQLSFVDAGRQVTQITDLLARQSRAPQLSVRRGEYVLGRRRPARIQVEKAIVNRRRGLTGQLLEHDRANQRMKMRPARAIGGAIRADALHHHRQHGIDLA